MRKEQVDWLLGNYFGNRNEPEVGKERAHDDGKNREPIDLGASGRTDQIL